MNIRRSQEDMECTVTTLTPTLYQSRVLRAFLITLVILGLSASASAKKKKKKKAKEPTEIAIDVAVGGGGLMFPGVIQDQTPYHATLRLDLHAIITNELIKKNKNRIPKKYRQLALKQEELRFRPGAISFIPTNVVISPMEKTQLYGANWGLLGVGVAPKLGPLRLGISAQLQVSAFYLSSDLDLQALATQGSADSMDNMMMSDSSEDPAEEEGTSMFFLRPGLSLAADLEIPLKKDAFAVSIGWKSTAYLPQDIGGGVLDMSFDNLDGSMWLMHQVYLDFHFRVPYSVKL